VHPDVFAELREKALCLRADIERDRDDRFSGNSRSFFRSARPIHANCRIPIGRRQAETFPSSAWSNLPERPRNGPSAKVRSLSGVDQNWLSRNSTKLFETESDTSRSLKSADCRSREMPDQFRIVNARFNPSEANLGGHARNTVFRRYGCCSISLGSGRPGGISSRVLAGK